jgi:uncharacterized protein (DUF924 family)
MTTFSSLHEYWFGELTDGFSDDAHRGRWFNGGADFDAALGERFSPLIEAAGAGELTAWCDSPRGTLAYVLVCDQLPRNIYRGTSRAFATDPLALAAARRAVESGADRHLGFDERSFIYMPFEHSEALLDQHTSIGLFMGLRDETPKGRRELIGGSLRHAQQHRDVIRRFARFPHRNLALGRHSTAKELEFVAQGDSFGQSKDDQGQP